MHTLNPSKYSNLYSYKITGSLLKYRQQKTCILAL